MNFKIYAPIYNCSGYARFRHIILELVKNGHNVQLIPYRDCIDRITIENRKEFEKLEHIKIEDPYISIHVGLATQFDVDEKAIANVGYTMFEANTIPNNWIKYCNKMDMILVPSTFCQSNFQVAGVNNVKIVQLGTNIEFAKVNRQDNRFTFLTIGAWIDRKGWDVLLQAYIKEFKNQDNVVLKIKTLGSVKLGKDLIYDYLDKLPELPTIAVCNAKLNEDKIPLLYQQADCYVLPSLGEAFSLTYLEALASGIPVIASRYGGHLDYLDDENSELIDVKRMVPATERMMRINKMYYGLLFAEPNIDHLKQLMRKVYMNRNEDKIKNGLQTIKKYTWSMAAKQLINACI